MPTPFRIATFNVENLFSRAKVLNLADHEETDRLLKEIVRLTKLLGKATYSAADKQAIETLLKALKPYVSIREDRGKLLNPQDGVSANGAGAWDGVVEFKRAEIAEVAREAPADVIKALKADVLCVVEAEDRLTLRDFNSQALDSKKYSHVLLIDGNDPRGIDVGLFTNLDLGRIDTHLYDEDKKGEIFSRDCLQVELLKLPNGKPLHILCNHLKSKGYGSQVASDAKRQRQTTRLAEILGKYDLAQEYVVVAGDMNDTPDSGAMSPLLTVADLYDALELQFGPDTDRRWTYRYSGRNQQIDYLLVSKPLKEAFVAAGVERRGIWGIETVVPGVRPFKAVDQRTHAASDHGGVWAEFTL